MDMHISSPPPTASTLLLAIRPSTAPPNNLPALCFQSLATIKFCNSSVLITIRIAGDGGTSLSSSILPYILPSSVYSNPCVFTLFTKLPGWGGYSSQIGTFRRTRPSPFSTFTFPFSAPSTLLPFWASPALDSPCILPRRWLTLQIGHKLGRSDRDPGEILQWDALSAPKPGWRRKAAATGEIGYGFNGLEGTPHFRFDFDSRAADHGGAQRAHQLQPAPQGMPHARQAAAVLPDAQPHHRALGSSEGLRIRKRSVRALRRNRTRQDRAGLGEGRGDSRVHEARRSGSRLFRRVVLPRAG